MGGKDSSTATTSKDAVLSNVINQGPRDPRPINVLKEYVVLTLLARGLIFSIFVPRGRVSATDLTLMRIYFSLLHQVRHHRYPVS